MQTATTAASSVQKALSSESATLANLLKNPLLNPALLSINPSLYAVQLAQLQAALAQSAGLQQLVAAAMPKKEEADTTPAGAAAAVAAAATRKRKLEEEQVLNLTSSVGAKTRSPAQSPSLAERLRAESPLDLSGSKRPPGFAGISPAKAPKLDAESKFPVPPWAAAGSFPFLSPFLSQEAMQRFPGAAAAAAAAAAAGAAGASPSLSSPPAAAAPSSPSALDRNPLEKMSEIAKSGGHHGGGSRGAVGGPRQSAWQSQWINRGPEATKEIFKCVWCKDSFTTLQALTTHMRETKHFGSSIPPSPQVPVRSPQSVATAAVAAAAVSSVAKPQLTPPTPPASTAAAATSGPKSRDILKEQLPLPRKLVRGQDVWLGRGEQQTKDILKCMWCGESFRSLDLMTKHMQETKHYTKVISQEQLVSWKSNEQSASSQNHVNAVLTCKVCEQAFSSLKELSDHMVKNNHYKETPTATPVSAGSPSPAATSPSAAATAAAAAAAAAAVALGPSLPGSNGARSIPGGSGGGGGGSGGGKEKRKKSLPVRKLLELERAQQELTGQFKSHFGGGGAGDDSAGKISCEKCGEKILMHLFVDHIRQCLGPMRLPPTPTSLADLAAANPLLRRTPSVSPPRPGSGSRPPTLLHDDDLASSSSPGAAAATVAAAAAAAAAAATTASEPKSILGSLEKMVQNNFGAKKKPGADANLSILQRLGIDEGVDYSKPLVDPMAMFRPPPGAAAAAAAAAGMNVSAAARLAAGLLPPLSTATAAASSATETRSNSECSSPDRLRQERPPSIKSEHSSSAKSASPPPSQQPLPATDFRKSRSISPKAEDEAKTENDDDKGEGRADEDNADKKEAAVDEEGDKASVKSKELNHSSVASPVSSPPLAAASTPGGASSSRKSEDGDHRSGDEGVPAASEEDKEDGKQQEEEGKESGGKKKKSHPLAALQMLCDKTEKTPKTPASTSAYGGPTDPGAILAFSWACNQAVVNDSLLKCPFCDTPFISKGAYRHHLSKMHFVKDGQADPKMLMAAAAAAAGGTPAAAAAAAAVAAAAAASSSKSTPEGSPGPSGAAGASGAGGAGAPAGDSKEENAQSKFAKYSQLAKQLSCSSQP